MIPDNPALSERPESSDAAHDEADLSSDMDQLSLRTPRSPNSSPRESLVSPTEIRRTQLRAQIARDDARDLYLRAQKEVETTRLASFEHVRRAAAQDVRAARAARASCAARAAQTVASMQDGRREATQALHRAEGSGYPFHSASDSFVGPRRASMEEQSDVGAGAASRALVRAIVFGQEFLFPESLLRGEELGSTDSECLSPFSGPSGVEIGLGSNVLEGDPGDSIRQANPTAHDVASGDTTALEQSPHISGECLSPKSDTNGLGDEGHTEATAVTTLSPRPSGANPFILVGQQQTPAELRAEVSAFENATDNRGQGQHGGDSGSGVSEEAELGTVDAPAADAFLYIFGELAPQGSATNVKPRSEGQRPAEAASMTCFNPVLSASSDTRNPFVRMEEQHTPSGLGGEVRTARNASLDVRDAFQATLTTTNRFSVPRGNPQDVARSNALRQLLREQRTDGSVGLCDLRARTAHTLDIVADREKDLFRMLQVRLESAESLNDLVAFLKVKQSLIELLETRSDMAIAWAGAFEDAERAITDICTRHQADTLRD